MKLVEGGSFLKSPFFLADSIGDLGASRTEVLRALNPAFAAELTIEGGLALPEDMSGYYQAIKVMIPAVNHDTYKRSEDLMGLRLWDSTGELRAKMPAAWEVWGWRLKMRDLRYNIDHWKNMWSHRGVLLLTTYTHTPRDRHDTHQTGHRLIHVFNYPYKDPSSREVTQLDSRMLGRPVGI